MTRNTDGRILVTDAMIDKLREWQAKTGFGMVALFRYAEINGLFDTSKSLNAPAFNNILAGKTRTVVKSDYETVRNTYELLPQEAWGKQNGMSRQKVRVPVTDDFKTRLQSFFDAKTMSRAKILKYAGAPKSLTSTKLGRILKRDNTTILKSHRDFLESLMQSGKNT